MMILGSETALPKALQLGLPCLSTNSFIERKATTTSKSIKAGGDDFDDLLDELLDKETKKNSRKKI